jgi:hypothetical protein
MTELVDPLAMGAPPPPGVVVIPDVPDPPAAPAADPLDSLFFAVIPDHAGEICQGASDLGPCLQVLAGGSRIFKLPSGLWRCAWCARRAIGAA